MVAAPMGGYVDLHSHYLPGLDDGAKTPEMTLQLVSALAELGFTHLCATPHQRAGMFMPERSAIDAAMAATRTAVAQAFPGISLDVAAENFWDDVFHERLVAKTVPAYAGAKAFLFEVNPAMLPPRIEQALFDIRMGGQLPVMAHPERYARIQDDLSRAESIGRTAALLIDLAALDGAHGRRQMKTARRLLQENLVHAATSDMHSADDERPIRAGMAWIVKQFGQARLDRLLIENPRAILGGELPDAAS